MLTSIIFRGGYHAAANSIAFGMGLFAAFLMGVADLAAQVAAPGSTAATVAAATVLGMSVWQLVAGVGSAGVVWGVMTMRVKRLEESDVRHDREVAAILERLNRDHDDLIRMLATRLDEQNVVAEIKARLMVLETTRGRRREDHH
jgi:hypothetical protein